MIQLDIIAQVSLSCYFFLFLKFVISAYRKIATRLQSDLLKLENVYMNCY